MFKLSFSWRRRVRTMMDEKLMPRISTRFLRALGHLLLQIPTQVGRRVPARRAAGGGAGGGAWKGFGASCGKEY